MKNWQPRVNFEDTTPPFPMPHGIWKVLQARGLQTADEIHDFLSPKLKDLTDPFKLQNMDKAVERLIQAYKAQEKVAIYADFDLDGTSGLALLVDGLTQMGFRNVTYYQPQRLSEGYGLHTSAIDKLLEQNVSLIVTVDVGITALEASEYAREKGVDLIITDHHLPKETLPNAYTVVNPNGGHCSSGLEHLCGAGVAFYVLLALRFQLKAQGLLDKDFNPKDVLDYFIIGTLTDMVPLIKENRILVKHGLIKISQTHRPGLRKLMEKLNLYNRMITSQEVAINLAPKLNALSRLEANILPRDVLMVEDEVIAEEMVGEVMRTQELRKQYQQNAIETAYDLMTTMEQQGYIWVWSHEFHKGVIGLVATRLSKEFHCPCFVGSVDGEGKVSASSRLADGSPYNLTEILKTCEAYLDRFGGHRGAAGFTLDIKQTLELDQAFQEYFKQNPNSKVPEKRKYDAVAKLEDLTINFMKWFANLEPFGKDFPPVELLFEKVFVYKLRELSGGHLRFTFKQGATLINGILFSPSDQHKKIKEKDFVSIVAEPQWNHFNGRKTIQLMIKDIQ